MDGVPPPPLLPSPSCPRGFLPSFCAGVILVLGLGIQVVGKLMTVCMHAEMVQHMSTIGRQDPLCLALTVCHALVFCLGTNASYLRAWGSQLVHLSDCRALWLPTEPGTWMISVLSWVNLIKMGLASLSRCA